MSSIGLNISILDKLAVFFNCMKQTSTFCQHTCKSKVNRYIEVFLLYNFRHARATTMKLEYSAMKLEYLLLLLELN